MNLSILLNATRAKTHAQRDIVGFCAQGRDCNTLERKKAQASSHPRPFSISFELHVWVIRPFATLGRCPCYVFAGVFDVTGFAVNAVLRIDLEAWV